MRPPDKPHWFRWTHAAFGAIPLVSIVATVAVLLSDELTNSAGEVISAVAPRLFMVGLSLVFLGMWLGLLWRDKRKHDRYTYIEGDTFGIMVDPGGYGLDQGRLIGETLDSIVQWSRVFPSSKIVKLFDGLILWVVFKKEPLLLNRVRVAGYSMPKAKIFVSYKESSQPLRKTAYQHELGHVIQGNVTGSWNQGEHHQRAKDVGLR